MLPHSLLPQAFLSSNDLPGRVFIARIFRSRWCGVVVQLNKELGPENVLYESGSWDSTTEIIQELDQRLEKLGVARSIILDETTHMDEISKPPTGEGWIETKSGKKELRRIPYLAGLRDIVLEPWSGWDTFSEQRHLFNFG